MLKKDMKNNKCNLEVLVAFLFGTKKKYGSMYEKYKESNPASYIYRVGNAIIITY